MSVTVLLITVKDIFPQVAQCGIYTKPAAGSQSGVFYSDRFSNTFSEEELTQMLENSTVIDCQTNAPFNLLMEETQYNGLTFPTPEQESLICEVFNYLGGQISAPGNGGIVNIQVIFDPGLAGSGTGGIGSPLFAHQCGIGYSIVQEQLNTQNPSLPTSFIHGYIRINPEYNWYTELDLTPAINDQQIDLYTVVLHEALHVLGFGSQIGASGNSLQGFYTLYDLHLVSSTGDPMILSSVEPGACCLEYEFNSPDFPNMPDPILTCGNIEYDVAQNPPAHGQYTFTPPLGNAMAANILSHLNITCGAEDYVMHAGIGFGAFSNGIPNIRRVLTAAETSIMCSLGYDMGTSCSAECFVIVRDDGPFVLNEPTEILPYSWLTANDFEAGGNSFFLFDFNCGDAGNLTFTPNSLNGTLTIALNNTPFGEYEFCYTLFSCNGEQCQSGTVSLIVAEEIDPSVCLGDDCNLVSYGDFELFPSGWNNYYQSFVEPFNTQKIIIPSPSDPPSLDNSVDIYPGGNNQFVRFIRCIDCSQENLLVPLCEEIPANCDVSIEFDACADNQANNNQPVTLGVWLLSQLPAQMELPNTTFCNGVLMDNADNPIGICVGEVTLSDCNIDPGSPVDFTHYSFTLPNGWNEPITHVWFFDYPVYLEGWTEIGLDNVVVTTSCKNNITITPAVLEACIGGQAVIELEVCLEGAFNIPAGITITPNLQGSPGIYLAANNPDFPNGTATAEDLLPGDCVTFTLFLDVSTGFQPGTIVTFPLGLQVDGACVENPGGQTVSLTLDECENLYCDCPEGSIVIGSPGVETLLSDLVAAATLPASPPLNIPFNITVRGTLVIDANVITGAQNGAYLFPPLSDVCMDSGAEIRIPPNNTLTIFDSYIRGCVKRWKSITVEHDATLNFAGDGHGLVEDGQYAVHPKNKSTVSIVHTRFNKNYIALYFNDPLGEFFLQPFFNNTIQCTETLLPHFNSQDPNDGPWSFAGIHTTEQDFLAIGGVTGLGANRFDGLRNGIITENCNLTLRNSCFNNIQRLDYATAGNGVMASGNGHNFQQDGFWLGAKVFFDNCLTGIFLKGMNAKVRNNEMNNVATGVLVRESPNRDIEIRGNIINCTSLGISLWFNDPAQRIHVFNNAIHVAPPAPDIRAAAIFVRENGAAQPNARIWFHDNMSIFNAGAGISLNGCNGYKVEQNFIDASQEQNGMLGYAGITLWNSPDNFFTCNRVNGDYENNPIGSLAGPFGIRARASAGVEYDCNDLQDTYLGIQFDMPCGDTKLRTTRFLNHRLGLHYTQTGVTGHQPMDLQNGALHGNRWNGTWGGPNAVGARHENPNLDFVNQSRYVVKSIAAPWGPQNPQSASPIWFDDEPFRPELSCGDTCNVWLTGDPPTGELDEQIAQGLVDPGVFTETMQWLLGRDLYRKLYANPELIAPESVFDTFFTANSTGTVGRFTAVEAAIHSLFKPDTGKEGQLLDYHDEITVQMENIGVIDSLLQKVSGPDSLNLLEQRKVSLGMIDSISQLNNVLVNFILQERSAAANSIVAQNNAIATTGIWEENEKTVSHIFLGTVVKGLAPNDSQLGLLRSIAAQCPYEGGTAVFRARALLGGWTEAVFDDEALCGHGGLERGLILPPSDNESKNTGIRMYPNPANGLVTLNFEEALASDAILSVYNLSGQLAGRYTIPQRATWFSFTAERLSSGIYLVRIQGNNKAIFSGKLMISH